MGASGLEEQVVPAIHTPLLGVWMLGARLLRRNCVKKPAEGADNSPPDTPILTLNRTGVMVVMLEEGGVTFERMDMMAEGGRGDKWRVMSDNCNTV